MRSAPDLNENGFTDDTVLTVAVAHAILTSADMAESLKKFATEHYSLIYGRRFKHQQKSAKTLQDHHKKIGRLLFSKPPDLLKLFRRLGSPRIFDFG
ncbi:MAG: hypothetical protein RBR20_01700 [Desulfobacterales bacterium]|nr:hypothetical protein [Desulfobacterales bacterium]